MVFNDGLQNTEPNGTILLFNLIMRSGTSITITRTSSSPLIQTKLLILTEQKASRGNCLVS